MASERLLVSGAVYRASGAPSRDWAVPGLRALQGTSLREEGQMDLQTVLALSQG